MPTSSPSSYEASRPLARTRYAFLTLPHYSMIALTNAIEPLRMANRVSGHVAYEWVVASLDGEPAVASNGMMITPTIRLAPPVCRCCWPACRRPSAA